MTAAALNAPLWRPPALPGIGQSDALWNAILSHAGTVIPLADDAQLTFAPAQRPAGDRICTQLRLGDGDTAFAAWTSFPFEALFGTALTVEDLPVLPAVLRDALIEGMTDFVSRAIPAGTLNGIAAVRSAGLAELAELADADDGGLAWFDASIAGLADEPVVLTFGCARSWLLSAAENGAVMPAAVQAQAKEALTVSAAYTLGATRIFVSELARLTEGTVILLPAAAAEIQTLRIGETLWDFRYAGGGWSLAGHRKRLPGEARRRIGGKRVTEQVTRQGNELPGRDRDRDVEESAPAEAGDIEAAAFALPDRDAAESRRTNDTSDAAEEPAVKAGDDAGEDTGTNSAEPDGDGTRDGTGEDTGEDTGAGTGDEAGVETGDEDRADVPASEHVRIGDLAVTVDFDIGERDFTLAELETWQKDAVVALDPPNPANRVEVTLRANGRTIALGDLVSIDGRLAVRLSQVLLSP